MDDETKTKPKNYLARGDRTATAGCVIWPLHLPFGDMGTAVYALVPVMREWGADPFVRCLDATPVQLERGESGSPGYAELFPPHTHDSREILPSDPVLAAVCLGTTGGGFYAVPDGRNWECTRDDLTPEGRALCDALEKLYERPVLLVTLVDT